MTSELVKRRRPASRSVLQRLKSRVQTTRRRFTAQALILHYHSVAELTTDPFLINVTPSQFAEQLAVLGALGKTLPLAEFIHALHKGKVPRRAIVVTFDDGYANNLQHAKPLLEKFGVPATVFVTTGAVQSQREFWWDKLEQLLLQPGELPAQLKLRVNGSVQQWDLGEAVAYTEQECGSYRAWSMASPTDPTVRHRVFRQLYEKIYPLSDAQKWRVLEDLASVTRSPQTTRGTHRALRPEELVELTRTGIIDVGAHTITHTPLTFLDATDQRVEIEGSKTYLEQVLSRPVASFAYPHGLFGPETAIIVREAGFVCACATTSGTASRGSDLFALPRLLVQNWDGEEFGKQLHNWMSA